jgi:ribosomal protein S18 acetylase RimI-like enzyme
VIVPATEGDAERIARLHIASWQATYSRELSQEFLRRQDLAGRTSEWRRRLAAGDDVLLATEGEDAVGFVACGPPQGGEGPVAEWEIYNLHVAPSWQGRGHGSQLFDAAVEIGRRRGARELVLWVVNSNDGARAFYGRKGMLPDGGAQEHRVSPEERLREVRYRRALS